MSMMNTTTYKANRKPDDTPDDGLLAIGDFAWRYGNGGVVLGLALVMPNRNGNGRREWIPVKTNAANPHGTDKSVWLWNGDMDLPTLAPSLKLENEWHGHLDRGMLHCC